MLTIQREGVPNISIPQIWGVTGHEEDYLRGETAPVGQTTKYASLEKFAADAFIYAYQDVSLARPRNIKPLVSYLRQMKAPKTREALQSVLVANGKTIFRENCQNCHDGKFGESTKLYPTWEVDSIKGLENPRVGYRATTPIAKLVASLSDTLAARLEPAPVGIKSRRLTGIWARQDLMTHGSIDSLNTLLCLDSERPKEAMTHHDLCLNYSLSEREALGQFLKTL
jgi:mono/diheme cytochrome c family protein